MKTPTDGDILLTQIKSSLTQINRWLRDRKNRPSIVVGSLGIGMLVLWIINIQMSPNNPSQSTSVSTSSASSNTVSSQSSGADNEATKGELKKIPWVKDLYVSPGHMNVGVIRTEKVWTSPMIGEMVCGILRRTGSDLTHVRFVDIEEVTYQQKSPSQAEIYSMQCR